MVRLAIYDNFLVISYTSDIVLTWDDITRIEPKKNAIFRGFLIHHNKIGPPEYLIIWSDNSPKIIKIIESKLNQILSLKEI